MEPTPSTFKLTPMLQHLEHAGIWYCEEGPKKLYLGLVISGKHYRIVNVLAESYQEAYHSLAESGQVLLCQPLSELISEFIVQEAPERDAPALVA